MRLLFVFTLAGLGIVYLVSYFALVTPSIFETATWNQGQAQDRYRQVEPLGGCATEACRLVYWPLNQCDRRLRPNYWAAHACIW